MSFFLPARVRQTALEFGEAGERWLEALPAHVAELQRSWGLAGVQPFETEGYVSWVAAVRCADGAEAVLKVGIPHEEARYEAEALRYYAGDGPLRLLRVSEDGFSLLLERCVPGTNLWPLSESEGNVVAARLLRRLWREPAPGAPFQQITALVQEWEETVRGASWSVDYGSEMVEQALSIARRLADTEPRRMLLHGDFHPGNVLAAQREPWLAIDCKPLVGEPAFDLAQWLGNRCEVEMASADPAAAMRRNVEQMSELTGLDPERVAAWAFAKSVCHDFGADRARVLRMLVPSV